MWSDPRFQVLSADARLLLLNLRTGSFSNLPGINHVYQEAIERETGLTPGEITNAFAELQKHSFVVLDRGVAWVRDQLRTDPSREGDPNCTNPKHRTAIESILGSLPRESLAVKKFRNTYNFPTHRVARTPRNTSPDTSSDRVGVSPEIGDRRTENRDRRTEIGKGERERKNQDRAADAHLGNASSARGSSHNGPVRREEAPAEWFNDCPEGRQRRCVRTEFFGRVDLAIRCSSHEKER
jgi:hypothetical protein